jgi:hypothetical protein
MAGRAGEAGTLATALTWKARYDLPSSTSMVIASRSFFGAAYSPISVSFVFRGMYVNSVSMREPCQSSVRVWFWKRSLKRAPS